MNDPRKASKVESIVPAAIAAFENAGLACDRTTVLRFASSLLAKKFLICTGLSGSGKTKLAQAFASWISPKSIARDPFEVGNVFESAIADYEIHNADSIAVEFWNQSRDRLIKVTLPREIIHEWAEVIREEDLPPTTSARAIRELVKERTQFSTQLHSFETHLKAAAFAFIDAQQSTVPDTCHVVVPVGADWMGNENLLGYPDGLDAASYVAKPALNLVMNAEVNRSLPHFLILDEMNLSHVERYFSDFLSAMESGEPIPLYQGGQRTANGRVVPNEIRIPENLFVVGTVNIDETTYMFSPKVLDRANVIEFRVSQRHIESFLISPAAPNLGAIQATGAEFAKAFVTTREGKCELPANLQSQFQLEMALFFSCLKEHGGEFGYRVAHDAARLVHFVDLLSNTESRSDTERFDYAFDIVVAQKILPKLHGSRTHLGPILKRLWCLCTREEAETDNDWVEISREASMSTEQQHDPSSGATNAKYPISAEKIERMWRLLNDNGFTSFAEA